MADNVVKLRPVRPCPVCGKPATQADHPFCSPRCADIDLSRWLSGAYVIPGAAEKADDDDALPNTDSDQDDD